MNPRFVKNYGYRRLVGFARMSALVLILLTSSLLVSCGDSDPAPAAEVVGLGYEVREIDESAWGSIEDHNDLTMLDDLELDTWTDLLGDGMVTTDSTGVAELRNTEENCSELYIYEDSGIQTSPCEEDSPSGWNCTVGTATAENCEVGLASPSTNITTSGTWISLITLDNGALSIVTVLDGVAKVVPVTQLEYKYEQLENHAFALTFVTRVLDEKQTVILSPGQSTFTASDAYLEEHFPALKDLWRTPLNSTDFQILIDQLLPLYPMLPGYIEDVSLRATQDSLIFPATLESTILLEGLGGSLVYDSLAQVVLQGVDWKPIQEIVAETQPVRLTYLFSGQTGLLIDQEFNLDLAQQASFDAEVAQYDIVVLVPLGDTEIFKVADYLVTALTKFDIRANIKEISSDTLSINIDASLKEGQLILWLTRP
ncbi:MAG: hypothetical protein MUC85_05595 [Anaerolineales bacterium]|jgi:hypothetical protein|nr:hypothetical protein [Anaerolineales bacterium]